MLTPDSNQAGGESWALVQDLLLWSFTTAFQDQIVTTPLSMARLTASWSHRAPELRSGPVTLVYFLAFTVSVTPSQATDSYSPCAGICLELLKACPHTPVLGVCAWACSS